MSVERAIEQMIEEGILQTDWDDVLCDSYPSLGTFGDLESLVDDLRNDIAEMQCESKFSRYVEAMEAFDKLQATVERLTGELDAIKTRKTLLDYLKFWSK